MLLISMVFIGLIAFITINIIYNYWLIKNTNLDDDPHPILKALQLNNRSGRPIAIVMLVLILILKFLYYR